MWLYYLGMQAEFWTVQISIRLEPDLGLHIFSDLVQKVSHQNIFFSDGSVLRADLLVRLIQTQYLGLW